jgi:2,3-bisphosphoglycerate-dependent phosphoglycerate mutase
MSRGQWRFRSVDPVSTPREYRQSRFTRPPGSCEILLVRHGESAPYVEGTPLPLVDGQSDPPLHPDGERQAEQVADRLVSTGEPISAVYVTTMQRTRQTAAPLLARLGLEPIVEPDLREVHLGDWEGGEFRRHMLENDPIAVEVAAQGRWDVIPGAEPNEAFQTRVRGGIERIAAAHVDEVVVAVVHGGVIGQVLSIATGATGFSFVGADNASISHVVVTPERWVVRCYNDTSHLSPTFSVAAEPLI